MHKFRIRIQQIRKKYNTKKHGFNFLQALKNSKNMPFFGESSLFFVILIVKGPSSHLFVISFCNRLSKKRYKAYELNWFEWIQTEPNFLKPPSKIIFWHVFYIFYNNHQNYKPSKSRFNDCVSSYPCLEIMNSNFNVILVKFPSK